MNWSTFVQTIEKNFPMVHKEIMVRFDIKFDTRDVRFHGVYECAKYVTEFIKITGCDMDIRSNYYSDLVDWALEMKKKNEMIEYVWML